MTQQYAVLVDEIAKASASMRERSVEIVERMAIYKLNKSPAEGQILETALSREN